ncbi:MAG: hypothetical protein ACOX2L_00175 [Anaerolineae bacterium]|nr:hypothetical protein [Chloroflexota bacterium]
MGDIGAFSALILRRPLRPYQLAPARAIARSVLGGLGHTYAVMMSRQAGKNETSAQLEAWLLQLYRRRGGSIIKAAPTYRPQALNSLLRLRSVLAGSPLPPLTAGAGGRLSCGNAAIAFYSAARGASVVGATADILLEGDEAQDLDPTRWQKDFMPMAAARAATTVLWGTAWTADTLLARTIRGLEEQQARDGIQRVFRVPWQEVARCSPAYGRFVQGEIARLGARHPLIRTQYLLEELEDQAGLFSSATRALMQGTHRRERGPRPGASYALLVDVAGGLDVSAAAGVTEAGDGRRDSTVATLVEIQQTPPGAPAGDGASSLEGLPRYLVRDRMIWTGAEHHVLLGALSTLAERWAVRHLVIDATGLGAGLASALGARLGPRVIPFIFGTHSKSQLGWRFLALCNSGRFQDHAPDGSPEQERFWREVAAARYTLGEGPGQGLRWGVPEGAGHDDALISAALCAALPQQALPSGESHIVESEEWL